MHRTSITSRACRSSRRSSSRATRSRSWAPTPGSARLPSPLEATLQNQLAPHYSPLNGLENLAAGVTIKSFVPGTNVSVPGFAVTTYRGISARQHVDDVISDRGRRQGRHAAHRRRVSLARRAAARGDRARQGRRLAHPRRDARRSRLRAAQRVGTLAGTRGRGGRRACGREATRAVSSQPRRDRRHDRRGRRAYIGVDRRFQCSRPAKAPTSTSDFAYTAVESRVSARGRARKATRENAPASSIRASRTS